jgi:hypothetical protein
VLHNAGSAETLWHAASQAVKSALLTTKLFTDIVSASAARIVPDPSSGWSQTAGRC